MFLTFLMLVVALCLSAIAAFYSIIGLTAIFAAAAIPVAIMGTILEIAKLTVTVWLHEYWQRCRLLMKWYLVPAVVLLMIITSMGIFGFLSKAHLDQSVISGDAITKIAIYDEKIKSAKENIETNRRALKQMDDAVEQLMSRTTDEQGATKAANLRRSQQGERTRLQNEIAKDQTKIQQLNEERAPIAAEVRKVEAEVGPIKYIAALIYGDNPDATVLERAVRWVIIILVMVFDPLAIFMLLASTESYKWEKYNTSDDTSKKSINDTMTRTRDWAQGLWSRMKRSRQDADVDIDKRPPEGLDERLAGDHVDVEPVVAVVEPDVQRPKIEYQILDDADSEEPPAVIHLPDRSQDPVPEVDHAMGFGPSLPEHGEKGDQFIVTANFPTRLYKHNGEKWIEINKQITDQYAYNDAYIDHLIEIIGRNQYDPELLTDAEREQIKARLRQDIK